MLDRKFCLQRLVLLSRGTEKAGDKRACKMFNVVGISLPGPPVFHARWGSPTCLGAPQRHGNRCDPVSDTQGCWSLLFWQDSAHRSLAEHREFLTGFGEESPVTLLLCALLALTLPWPVTGQKLWSVTDVLCFVFCPKPGGTCTVWAVI